MADSLGVLPTFTAGQVLSASVHLNGMQRYAQGLHDEFLGPQMPFCGYSTEHYSGFVRHHFNSLQYKVTLHEFANPPFHLRVNAQTVATFNTANTTYTGTASLAGLGLTVDNFYAVEVIGSGGYCWVELLREYQAITLPALASFANDTTPTAAQWQALSTYAGALADGLDMPVAAGRVAGGADTAGIEITAGKWTINHRCRYLAFKLLLQRPFTIGDDGLDSWTEAVFEINGEEVMFRHVGRTRTVPAGVDFEQNPAGTYTFTDTLDLDTYPGGLVQGDDYEIVLKIRDSSSDSYGETSILYYLYESPAASQALAGWSEWRTWEQGNYVWGDSNPVANPKLVKTIKDNLEVVGGLNASALNPVASARNEADTLTFLYGVRRRRWLHYFRIDDDQAQPKILWNFRGSEQSAGLPASDAADRFLALDFDSLEGLYPGTQYKLEDIAYAIEDSGP